MTQQEQVRNPRSVDEIDTGWFRRILAGKGPGPVQQAKVLEVKKGTATKIRCEITYRTEKSDVTETLWVKTGFEDHSHTIGTDLVYAGEVFYYQNVAHRYATRTPECLYAAYEPDTGNSVLVLKDMLALGARFMEPVETMSPEMTKEALRGIARYQASSWRDSFLTDTPLLAKGGTWITSNVNGWIFSPENYAVQSSRPRFKFLPAALRDQQLLLRTHEALESDWWTRDPYCVAHGDAHVGQAYVLPGGEVRLIDWQLVLKASWAYDYSYFMISSLSIADRRHVEQDMLRFHLDELAAQGVDPPDFDTAWLEYRANAFHGISWALCIPAMQCEENLAAMAERFAAALVDLNTIEAVHGHA
jgi:Ecdysteroid kinase-like family